LFLRSPCSTGAAAAQNATGNFVKVVQRLPVRIELENYDPDKSPLFIEAATKLAPSPHPGFRGTFKKSAAAFEPLQARSGAKLIYVSNTAATRKDLLVS
jgi:hypothetical protein